MRAIVTESTRETDEEAEMCVRRLDVTVCQSVCV